MGKSLDFGVILRALPQLGKERCARLAIEANKIADGATPSQVEADEALRAENDRLLQEGKQLYDEYTKTVDDYNEVVKRSTELKPFTDQWIAIYQPYNRMMGVLLMRDRNASDETTLAIVQTYAEAARTLLDKHVKSTQRTDPTYQLQESLPILRAIRAVEAKDIPALYAIAQENDQDYVPLYQVVSEARQREAEQAKAEALAQLRSEHKQSSTPRKYGEEVRPTIERAIKLMTDMGKRHPNEWGQWSQLITRIDTKHEDDPDELTQKARNWLLERTEGRISQVMKDVPKPAV